MSDAGRSSGKGKGATALAPQSVPPSSVLVQVHLWSSRDGASADVPPPALAMAADLLQVRGGELRDAPSGIIAASFQDLALAVTSARNVQRLIQGFACAWQDGILGACTTLTRADETSSLDPISLRDIPALQQTHPGQVIVLGSLCAGVRAVPGLEFRSIAASPQPSKTPALHLLPPQRMEGYTEQPFQPRPSSPIPVSATEITSNSIPPTPPVTPAYVLPSLPASGRTAAAISSPPSGSMRAIPPAPVSDEIGAFSRDEKPATGNRRLLAILGSIAAVLIAAVLVFTVVLKKPAQPASAATPAPLDHAPAPAPVPLNIPASAPQPNSPQTALKPRSPDPAHPKAASHDANPVAQTQSAPAPAEDIRPSRGLTFTPAEISSLIAHADRDSGNGNFDKAIQEYRLVLSREPANEAAKRGLARALYNKEHQ